MRILIVSQYFAPEVTAASLRLAPLASGLAARGHRVEVICEVPNHPHGIVDAAYRGRALVRREDDGYLVRHVWVRASPSKRARARLLSYGSFAAAAVVHGSAIRRPDVVLASSPPLSVGAVGAVLAARHRVPLVLDVRDLWPQIAVALGELSPGPTLRAAERLERWLYRTAAAVLTPTVSFRDHIAAIADGPEKVHVLPNGTTRAWLEMGTSSPDRSAASLPQGPFVWTYAGNLGLSQDLETAIEAARTLGDGYRLLLLGDGTARTRLEGVARERAPGKVLFRDSVPPADAMRIMRASDALLVSLADLPELGRSVPVKLYDSCALGRPVIAAVPGETRRMVEESGAALAVDPGDPRALAAAVRAVNEDRALADRLAAAGRAFATANLREDGIEQLDLLLSSVRKQRGARG
jgi:colanic acid biosynthesis glycosyl transferase WcaI